MRYLHYFVFITKHGTYIDGFAQEKLKHAAVATPRLGVLICYSGIICQPWPWPSGEVNFKTIPSTSRQITVVR
jgi:hypothetical protein